ncbi:MAG: aminotransferase class IV [Flavobacteriaceae bacterium]|nr:aminotransferase class IV [Flavobacteriaceae bacterium]
MVILNGALVAEENTSVSIQNRGFKYGDSIFETIKVANGKVIFWEEHYFRLMASMRMLRMKIPMEFTLEFLEEKILKLTNEHKSSSNEFRVRLTVFREDGGFYTPETNSINYLIEASPLNYITKTDYKVDVYKDFYHYSGLLSTVKTNNKMLNTLASIFAKENDLDNCILINENKGVVEVTNGNIFILKDNVVKTPAITEGCIKGVIRKKLIEVLQKNEEYKIEETSISPFEVQKADEVFITNAIIGIQPVTQYKKKKLKVDFSLKLAKNLTVLEFTN